MFISALLTWCQVSGFMPSRYTEPKLSLLAKQLVREAGALLVVSECEEQPMGGDASVCMRLQHGDYCAGDR